MARFPSTSSCEETQTITFRAIDARKDDLFKRDLSIHTKVMELWTLCVLENVLVLLSSGDKWFFIGKPGVYNSVYRFPTCRERDFDETDRVQAEEEATMLRLLKEAKDQLEKEKAKNLFMQLTKAMMENENIEIEKLLGVLDVKQLFMLKTIIAERFNMLTNRINELEAEAAASTAISCGESNTFASGSSENDYDV